MSARAVFDVPGLAQHWGVCTDTIYSLVRNGELQHFKLGGKLIRIRADEVERYECRQITPSNDCEDNSPSLGATKQDATDIRLERLIARPQKPRLVHSGKSEQ